MQCLLCVGVTAFRDVWVFTGIWLLGLCAVRHRQL